MSADYAVKRLDARSLRALAHPLRIEILGLLRSEGPATATQLARRLGESTGATSYHLRQLAVHGFVRDVRGRGSPRERWWEAAHHSTSFDVTEFPDDPHTRGAVDVFLHEILRAHFRRAATWLSEMRGWDARWVKAATASDYALTLGPARLAELVAEIHDIVERYRGQPDQDLEAERVAVIVHAFPERPSGYPDESRPEAGP
jgi:DNA-binding transcriptional ArsR family regulator